MFASWLRTSRAGSKDAVFVFSVGGGNLEKNVSPNIVAALKEAKERGTKIFGVVSRDGGYTKKVGDCVVVVPSGTNRRMGILRIGACTLGLMVPLGSIAAEQSGELSFKFRRCQLSTNMQRYLSIQATWRLRSRTMICGPACRAS